MNLSELFNYKNQLMDDLLTNKKIVRLLCDDEKNIDDPHELVYTQVFPYEYHNLLQEFSFHHAAA